MTKRDFFISPKTGLNVLERLDKANLAKKEKNAVELDEVNNCKILRNKIVMMPKPFL